MQEERVGDRRCWLDADVVGVGDWSKPQCFANTGSLVDWRGADANINVCVLDHEHFGCSEDGCVPGITVLPYRKERHVQVWDAIAFRSGRWKSKR